MSTSEPNTPTSTATSFSLMAKDQDLAYKASSIFKAYKGLRSNIRRTIIQRSSRLSDQFSANIFFKREDGQITRTYKVRGAFNKLQCLTAEEKKKGICCCSAGNLGVAFSYACNALKVKLLAFVPLTTPMSIIARLKEQGREFIEVKAAGNNLAECDVLAQAYSTAEGLSFVKLDDKCVIEGTGSVGIEILEDFPLKNKIDYVIFPISTGTLGAAISCYFAALSPETQIIGVTPMYSQSEMLYEGMSQLLHLDPTNTLRVMEHLPNYQDLIIPEGEAFQQVLQLYNEDGIILEPHGALAPASLKILQEKQGGPGSLHGKNIVCILTGKNTNISRMNEIKILANVYAKRFMYLLIDFFRKAEAIKEFMTQCLLPGDDVFQIEYTKKNNREKGPALVGIELSNAANYDLILKKMKELDISYKIITPADEIFQLKV